MKAFTTPTVAKIVNNISLGQSLKSNLGILFQDFQSKLEKINITKRPDNVDANSRHFGSMGKPKSSTIPIKNTGKAVNIKKIISSVFKSNTTASGINPKVKRGMSPNILI